MNFNLNIDHNMCMKTNVEIINDISIKMILNLNISSCIIIKMCNSMNCDDSARAIFLSHR